MSAATLSSRIASTAGARRKFAPKAQASASLLSRPDTLATPDALRSAGQGPAASPAPPKDPACNDGCEAEEGWRSLPHHKSNVEVWASLQQEAREQAETEPVLASYLHSSIIAHSSLEASLAFILANKLSSSTLLPTNLMQMILTAYRSNPELVDSAVADMQAVFDRDPACSGYMQIMLFFKGFQAIQAYRIAHYLWKNNRISLAQALQSRISQQFDVDIHPGAQMGKGVMMDHATGIVIGETAVIGDNVSMLHRVTIGGSGKGTGIRHPSIGHDVLLGAGTTVLGPVTIGNSTKVGAGSLVVTDIQEKSVAVGVPAKVIRRDKKLQPCKDMDQAGDFVLDFMI